MKFYQRIISPLDQFEVRNLLSLDLHLIMSFCIILTWNILETNYTKLVSNNWSIPRIYFICFTLFFFTPSDDSLLFLFIPVVIYSNAALNKSRIIQENCLKSGVYQWTNTVNGKIYIGSTKNISKRFAEYSNPNYLKVNPSMIICKALKKHGYKNFSFEILEYCDPTDLMERERYYLNLLWEGDIPRYNLSKDPTAPMLGRIHSPETLKKMSAWERSQETRNKISDAISGRNHSEETINKISEANKGKNNAMFGKPRPTGTGRPSQAIEVFDQDINETIVYESISAAARALDIPRDSIRSTFRINQQKPYKGRYIFKKVD